MVLYWQKVVSTVNELPPLFTDVLKAQVKVGVCIAAAVKTLSLVLWYFLAPEAPLIKN
jgi:hypothetical protein